MHDYPLKGPSPRTKVKNTIKEGPFADRDEIAYGFLHNIPFGKHAFVEKNEITDKLSEQYRTPVIMKVFDTCGELTNIKTYKWGDDPQPGKLKKNTLLWEATQIQNIAAWNGLAPKVYALDSVILDGKRYPCQIVEEEEVAHDWWNGHGIDDDALLIYEQVKALGEKYGFSAVNDDANKRDATGSKLLDFQTFSFHEPYYDFVRKSYIQDGKYGKVYYQDVPELDLKGGPRKSLDRIKTLALDKIDFEGKSVLDIGCAGGFFCRHAFDKGASYVRGVDMVQPIEAARNLANYLGKFGIDYEVADLSKGYDDEFDVVLFLSLIFHIKIPEAVKKAKCVVFEDNSRENRHNKILGKPWTDWFSKIEHVGVATDHGDKSIYHLRK
jgi:2-polyprenyl-3-methyl-5-hydroxy-6-metoxy-1,4-benzoquinol methylase